MKPECPHCHTTFDHWSAAKLHVKYCRAGTSPRKSWKERAIETIDCLYCSERFNDFASLTAHTVSEHNPQGYSKEEREKHMPLPKPTAEKSDQHPFLKPEHFGKKTSGRLQVIGVREAPKDSYSDVFVDVLLGKKQYTWGMKSENFTYAALHEMFGPNEKKWKGPVDVMLVSKGKNTYINVARD